MKLKGDIYIFLGGERVKATVSEIEFVHPTDVDDEGLPLVRSWGTEEDDLDTLAGALLVEDRVNVRLFDQLEHEFETEEGPVVVTYEPINAGRVETPKEKKGKKGKK